MRVVVGHCTWNDWALATVARQTSATVARQIRKVGNQTWYSFLEYMRPPQNSLARGDLLLVCCWDHRKWFNHFSMRLLICRTTPLPRRSHKQRLEPLDGAMTRVRLRAAILACARRFLRGLISESPGSSHSAFFGTDAVASVLVDQAQNS